MPLNIDFLQVLLHLLNFVILFGALYFLLYGPVKKFMQSREQMYKDMDEKSKSDMETAEKTREQYEKKLAKAEAEILRMKQQAESESEKKAQEIIDGARKDADKIIKKAHAEAQKEHSEQVRAARKEIANAASLMAEKIVGQSVSESYDSFIAATEESDGSDD